jgi:hypothetical protein
MGPDTLFSKMYPAHFLILVVIFMGVFFLTPGSLEAGNERFLTIVFYNAKKTPPLGGVFW